MFTGIIQAVGKIHEFEARGNDARMVINAGGLDDKVFAEEYISKGMKIAGDAKELEEEILGIVESKISK